MDIPLGARAELTETVTHEKTVAHLHPDMPEVYGTPVMIYLMEVASAAAIKPYLPEGWVSVGTAVNIRHLAATPVGMTVRACAEVIEVGSSYVRFRVEVWDDIEKIGEGVHERAPIEVARFQKRVQNKRSS